MKKHTKEYAEKLAHLHRVNISETWSKSSFTVGYMKAIEETNVKELLEACNKAFILCDKIQMPTESELNELKNVLNNAIKKAE